MLIVASTLSLTSTISRFSRIFLLRVLSGEGEPQRNGNMEIWKCLCGSLEPLKDDIF